MTGPWAGRLLDVLTALDPVDAPIPYVLAPAVHLVLTAPGHPAGPVPELVAGRVAGCPLDASTEDPPVTSPPTAFLLVCETCSLDRGPYLHAEEADQLAAIHDDLHHRGQPTARVETDPATIDRLLRGAR